MLCASLQPFDYVKTQMQKMKPDPVTGELPYSVSAAAEVSSVALQPSPACRHWRCRCRAAAALSRGLRSAPPNLFPWLLPCCPQSSMDCALKTLRKGPLTFYTGFPTCERPPEKQQQLSSRVPACWRRLLKALLATTHPSSTRPPPPWCADCVRIAPHAALTLVFVAWLPRLQAKVGM